jgi:hypothetical protein
MTTRYADQGTDEADDDAEKEVEERRMRRSTRTRH